MSDKNTSFIMTKDKETAEKLIALGFKEIKNGNGVFTFANNTKLNFDYQETKVVFSNSLCF